LEVQTTKGWRMFERLEGRECRGFALAERTTSSFTAPMVAARFTRFAPGCLLVRRASRRMLRAAGAGSRRAGLDQRLAQGSQQPRDARRPATSGPRPPVQAHEESPRRERRSEPQDLEVFISSIIFDRNSQVCLHKPRQPQPLTETNRARQRARSLSQLYCWVSARMQTLPFVVAIALVLTSCTKPAVVPTGQAFETTAASKAPTWRPPRLMIIYTNDNETIVPLTYTNKKSGVIYDVESDGRHVSASTQEGKLLWRRNPFVDAELEPYRWTKPVIVMIGTASDLGYGGDPDAILIRFSSSQIGWIDPRTGDFHYAGRN
jgi:hypothetical protein